MTNEKRASRAATHDPDRRANSANREAIMRFRAVSNQQVVFSHSLNARGRSIASGETEVVSPAKHKRDNAEAIFSQYFERVR